MNNTGLERPGGYPAAGIPEKKSEAVEYLIPENLFREVEKRKRDFQEAILNWAKTNLRNLPWRKNRTPYRVLIAEVMLRRTTSKAVLRIYDEFLRTWPDIKTLSVADVSEIERLLRAVGYHKRRAKILVDIARYIEENYGGEIPRDKQALLKIPHVGSYIAGAILSLGYGVPAAMVDSNVHRILYRCFRNRLPKTGVNKAIQEVAEALVPREDHVTYNLGLLDLGALVCRYDKPRCSVCPLQNVCDLGVSSSGK